MTDRWRESTTTIWLKCLCPLCRHFQSILPAPLHWRKSNETRHTYGIRAKYRAVVGIELHKRTATRRLDRRHLKHAVNGRRKKRRQRSMGVFQPDRLLHRYVKANNKKTCKAAQIGSLAGFDLQIAQSCLIEPTAQLQPVFSWLADQFCLLTGTAQHARLFAFRQGLIPAS